jgi:hypothetical protein
MRILLLLLPTIFLTACGSSAYHLPDVPSEEARRSVSLDPTVEEEESAERFNAARRTVLALYQALGASDGEAAYELLSNETRLLLDEWSDGNGDVALQDGLLSRDGTTWSFDPVEMLLLPDPVLFEDEVDGETESETARRKEIFITAGNDDVRRVVVILEAEQWKVHMLRIPQTALTRVPSGSD